MVMRQNMTSLRSPGGDMHDFVVKVSRSQHLQVIPNTC